MCELIFLKKRKTINDNKKHEIFINRANSHFIIWKVFIYSIKNVFRILLIFLIKNDLRKLKDEEINNLINNTIYFNIQSEYEILEKDKNSK